MANKGAILGIAAVGVLAVIVLSSKKVIAAGEYVCPYDGATFATLAELQAYEMAKFPGQRISIEIIWS